LADHFGRAPLFRLFGNSWATFFVSESLMQDQPDQLTLSMGNGADGLIVTHTWYRAAINNLENTSFGLYGGIGRLVENAPHVSVALGRLVVVVHTCTLVIARAGTHPRGELLGRRKGCGCGTDFGNVFDCVEEAS